MEQPTPPRHRRRERRRDRTAPAPAEPVVETTAQDTAAEDIPAQDTAAQDTAAQDTAAEDIPAQDAAAQDTAAQDTAAQDTAAQDAPVQEAPAPIPRRKSRARRTDAERSLRGIVGAGSSQVGVVGAMRARDAARPTPEDIAAAERDLVIVRRHYVPPDNLPGAR